MSEKSIRYIVYGLKAGLFVLPALSLIVAGTLFFPFITGKNFFFRIMVEIMFFLWVFVACFDKNYRPKKSPILIAIAATLFFLILATAFGANPYRSFWSNYERMEGLLGHIHLFLYFLIIASVFKKERDWKWFFVDLTAFSFLLVIYGFLQFFGKLEVHQGDIRLDATLGNATYYAIFLIFHLFFIGFLANWTKNLWLRAVLGVLFILEAVLVFMTATRGAILGLMGGAMVFALLMFVFSFRQNKKIRHAAIGVFAALILLVATFILFKDSSFIRGNYVLNRLAGISFSEGTTESRLTIWKMSFRGFLERPVLGWGPENFNIMWNKYYDPKLWKQEPWFDRAHNIIFDWLISAGLLGFLAYWSIWGAAIFILIKGYKKKQFSGVEISLFFGLFLAYGFHNLFVFDNLTSYFLFFTILGYLHFRHNNQEMAKFQSRDIGILSYAAITIVFIVVVFSLYFINLKPILAGRQLIFTIGQMRPKGADADFILKEFDKVFAYKTFGTIEAREQLGGYSQEFLNVPSFPEAGKKKVIQRAIQEMENQVKILPDDARAWVFLSTINAKAGRFDDALKAAVKASELSPKKQQIHFVLADVYLSAGQYSKAAEVLRRAYALDLSNREAAKNLMLAVILENKPAAVDELSKEFEENEIKIKADRKFVNAYAAVGNYEKVKEVWLEIIALEPNNAQNHISLAATYLQLGERENAVKELKMAAELNPEFKKQADYFIGEIEAGKNP